MLRSALLIVAGGITALAFACTLPPSPLPPSPPPPPAPRVAAACDLGAKAVFLATPFDPNGSGIPQSGGAIGTNGSYASDLNQALSLAPPDFQNRLCELSGLFIDQTACASPQECLSRSWGL